MPKILRALGTSSHKRHSHENLSEGLLPGIECTFMPFCFLEPLWITMHNLELFFVFRVLLNVVSSLCAVLSPSAFTRRSPTDYIVGWLCYNQNGTGQIFMSRFYFIACNNVAVESRKITSRMLINARTRDAKLETRANLALINCPLAHEI